MRLLWLVPAVGLFCLAPPLRADDLKKDKEPKSFQVPYRLTEMKHILVRAKINGKGPFHFIVDTGAPALFVSTAVAKKLGVQPNRLGWGTFDKFEIEGGVVVEKAKARIEDPFQLEGMNGLGLAGVRLDGLIGYTLLARYKMEIDFTKSKMGWTPLDFDPPAPAGLGGKGGQHPGLEAMGSLMKVAGLLLGKKAAPDISPRGFVGVELADVDGGVQVKSVLERSAAARAGLKPGDRITQFQNKAVSQASEVARLAENVIAGQTVRVSFQRARESLQASFKAEGGLETMKTSTAFFCLFFALSATAQEPAPKAKAVPFDLLKTKHMVVEAKVNGKGPYRLIFDTGAPISLINNKVARESGMIAKNAPMPLINLFGSMGPAKIKSLEVGDLKARDVSAVVMDHPTLEAISKVLGPIEGIVGFPFFARYKMTLDYQAKQMTFVPNGYDPPDAMEAMMGTILALTQDAPQKKVLAPGGQWGLVLKKDEGDEDEGVAIQDVLAGSAAADAGLKTGDRLLTLDGRWTDSVADAYVAAGHVKAGQSASVTVKRGDKQVEITVKPRNGV